MRPWALRAALALLLVQCGGGGSANSDDSLPLPDRLDPIDGGRLDASRPSPPADSAVDASPSCDVSKPFGAPIRLAELSATAHRSTPRLSADELTIYFTTAGMGTGADLSMVLRPTKNAPFGGEKVLPQSSVANDNDPSVGADHLSLWFHSDRNGSADIFAATRSMVGVPFGVAAPVAAVNLPAPSNEAHAYLRANELWFVSDRPGGVPYDIFVSVRSGSVFGAPTRVTELNSTANDFQPQPSEDGLTVVFASDRAGGLGKTDLWIAKRLSPTGPFAAPTPITELNSPHVESAGWLSADRCRIWFGSGRNTNDVNQQLFFAERPRL